MRHCIVQLHLVVTARHQLIPLTQCCRGWYTPAAFERFLPRSWQAARSINPSWQNLQPGDKVDDYGFSADDYFIVSEVQPERALVYRSDRYGAFFSW